MKVRRRKIDGAMWCDICHYWVEKSSWKTHKGKLTHLLVKWSNQLDNWMSYSTDDADRPRS